MKARVLVIAVLGRLHAGTRTVRFRRRADFRAASVVGQDRGGRPPPEFTRPTACAL